MSLRSAVRLAILVAGPAFAQGKPALELQLAPADGKIEGPTVSALGMLRDAHVQELLHSGFPAELHFRVELWRSGGMFNDLESSTTWDMRVQYDPYSQQYRVARRQDEKPEDLGSYPTLADAEAEVAKPYRVALRPSKPGQHYYYSALLQVRLLQVSDLDELQRWLSGDLQPAVRGQRNPFSAVKNGLGRLLSRILGGEKHDYTRQSPIFVAE